MKNNIFAIIALLSLTSYGYAQTTDTIPAQSVQPADSLMAQSTDSMKAQSATKMQRVSLGLRGGLAMTTGNKDLFQHKAGGNIAFDIQYAPYWQKKNTYLGLLVGASINYMTVGATMKNDVKDQYSVSTVCGPIDYTIAASNENEWQHQLMVEVPVMFSLVDKSGVFFNIGPRFAFPVLTSSKVSFSNQDIKAYFPERDVTVSNEEITGELNEDWRNGKQATWNAPYLRILVGTELGYEFQMKSGNALALGLYADCEVASFQSSATSAKSFISLTEPTDQEGNEEAKVVVTSPLNQYADKLGLFDLGLKLTYHFNVSK